MSDIDNGERAEVEPEYVIVQPGLGGVAWLGEIDHNGEASPIAKVASLLDRTAHDAVLAQLAEVTCTICDEPVLPDSDAMSDGDRWMHRDCAEAGE